MKVTLGEEAHEGDLLIKRPDGLYYKALNSTYKRTEEQRNAFQILTCDHLIARLDGDDELMTLEQLKEYILEQGRIYDDIEEDDFVILEKCPKCGSDLNGAAIGVEVVQAFHNRRNEH